MIELKDVTIQKGNTHILKKRNLKFQCGKSYALIGKSGCGKSTLLNTIAGTSKTPEINSLVERPFETRARNTPTNGLQLNHQPH